MATKANIVIDQGADFVTTVTVTDDNGQAIDLSTYTGAAQIRKHYTSLTYYTFDVDTNDEGIVTLTLSANTSNNITPGRYVYDCELTSGDGTKSRIVEGIVTIAPQVTR